MRLLAPALMLAWSCFASGDQALEVSGLSPNVVKPGDTVTVTGVSLGNDHVEEVYLTDHKFDMKVKVLNQTAKAIQFRIPPFAKAGRLQLLLLMKPEADGESEKLLEMPAFVRIEEISTTEITQVQPRETHAKAAADPPKDPQKDPPR